MVSFATEREAAAFADAARGQAVSRTCQSTVDSYVKDLHRRGLKETTIVTIEYRLRAMLELETAGGRQLRTLTPTRCATLYRSRTQVTKPDTHRNELQTARQFADWCVGEGWLQVNPFADVDGVGRRSAGKPQLRIDEARKYLDAALGEGTIEGVAASIPLLMGLRASEITDREVRDVDNGSTILWIDDAKTKAGIRSLSIPTVLQGPLAAIAANRPGSEPLFGEGRDRQWVYYHVTRIAMDADVPWTTPHSLRGLYASLSVSIGQPAEQVARSLGHADLNVTRRHYFAPGAEQQGMARRVTEVLNGLPTAAGSGERIENSQSPDADPQVSIAGN